MRNFQTNFYKHALPFLTILAMVLLLGFTNYTPGTFLTGWDNLHPEFNFGLNIKRSIFSVWQQYQGLGLLGGMAHASDLVHQVELFALSFVVKPDMLRYFYHFTMLFLGMFGTYLITRKFLSGLNEKTQTLSALVAGIFYGLNLGTIQYFYVPFEPYSTFFGFFPILLYSLFAYLEKPNRKTLAILAVINLLATPLAYVQTVFLVFFFCAALMVAIFVFFANGQSKRLRITHAFIALISILIINSFWLLPNLYFTATNVSITQNAVQNKMATEKFFQMNKNRGTIADLALLKEFYYDFTDLNDKTGTFDYLLKPWRSFTSKPLYIILGLLFFATAVFGLITKNSYKKFLIALAALCAIIFLSDTIIFSQIGSLFRATPLLNQVFRNPFTKFIVPLVFIYAVGLGLGIAQISLLLSKYSNKVVLPLVFIFLIIINAAPAFTGQFISPQMRQVIPKEYFDVFSYFKKQNPNAKIINLPQNNYWGWEYYSWPASPAVSSSQGGGYHGSGFLWYGIEQPIMDRTFDVWSTPLENYYWQLSYALKRRDIVLFNQIINKYNVGFILFDNNISLSDNKNALKADLNQEKLLTDNPLLESPVTFGNILIYKTKIKNSGKNISFYKNLHEANTSSPQYFDNNFAAFGNYTSHGGQDNFPFGSLFTNRFQDELNFKISQDNAYFTFESVVKKGNYDLSLPSILGKERALPSEIFAKRVGENITLRFIVLKPKLVIDKKSIDLDSLYQDVALPVSQNVQNIIVDINNTSFLPLNALSEQFVSIGKTYLLNESAANSIQIYSGDNPTVFALPSEEFAKAHVCGNSTGTSEFDSKSENGKLILNAKNVAVCALHTLSFPTSNTLYKASFEYLSSTDEFPQYCVYSEDSKKCINNKDAIFKGYSNNYAHFEEYFENNNKKDISIFQAILDATRDEDKNSKKTISYRNISVTSYPYISGSAVVFTTINDPSYSIPITLDHDAQISITVPKISGVYSYTNTINDHKFKKNPLSYNHLNNGLFQKDILGDSSPHVRLTSQNSSSYLLINGAALSPGLGYIVNIKSKTIAGFSPTVDIFTNKDSRNYIYTYVEKSEDFKNNYFVLPPLYEFDRGISILLGSSSYNKDKTINDISEVSFYTIPYEYLTNISLNPRKKTAPGTAIVPQNSQKSEIYLYKTEIPVGAKTIVLSQTYDSGWKAYLTQNSKLPSKKLRASRIQNFLNLAFPFAFGKEIKQHVQINGWANGWIINNSELRIQNSELIIVYLPQYLQYIGFALLFGFFGYFALRFLNLAGFKKYLTPRLKQKFL